jgi:hypothetical protein
MDNWKNNTIWFEDIPESDFLWLDYKKNKLDITKFADKKYAVLRHYNTKNKDFSEIPINNQIEYLELNLSNCTSFRGVERIKGIKRLELHYCTKLQSDDAISTIKDTLEWLHISMSKKITLSSEILSLKELKVLCLNDCGSIESLKFLEHFPNLLDFRFVNTNIIDGDLTPILKHPSLINAGFTNKRNYSHKFEHIDDVLKGKSNNKKKIISKGEWKTFRYDVFD